MTPWLRLPLVALTVGGGFTGVVITSQSLFSLPAPGAATLAICIAFLLLNVVVVFSGLYFVQNPHRTVPIIIALASQIPVLSSPLLAYQFAAGLYAAGGLTVDASSTVQLFGTFRFGTQWQFNLLQPLPWAIAVNIVPIIFLIALWQHRRNSNRALITTPPPNYESQFPAAQVQDR